VIRASSFELRLSAEGRSSKLEVRLIKESCPVPDLSDHDPLSRFTGLADVYSKCRPGYPDEAIEWVINHCGLTPPAVLVDIGCGTGISSRLFAQRGVQVIGIEPNAEMRARAESEPPSPQAAALSYHDGRAEQTGLPDSIADAVLAAQAFHWFDTGKALAEFHRILLPLGWVILMWNERDENDAFTAAYGAVVRSTRDAAAVEGPRGRAGEVLLISPLFDQCERVVFSNTQLVDEEGLLGRAFSASYAPRLPAEAEAFAEALRDVFARFARDGAVQIHYETSVYVGRRRTALPAGTFRN
jgi:SAM-dependent methyltransferase